MGAGSKPAWQSRALNRSINASSEKRNEIGDPSNKTSLLKNLDANYRHYPRKIRAERDAKLQLAHESRPESPLQSRRYHAHHRYSVSRTRIDKSLC